MRWDDKSNPILRVVSLSHNRWRRTGVDRYLSHSDSEHISHPDPVVYGCSVTVQRHRHSGNLKVSLTSQPTYASKRDNAIGERGEEMKEDVRNLWLAGRCWEDWQGQEGGSLTDSTGYILCCKCLCLFFLCYPFFLFFLLCLFFVWIFVHCQLIQCLLFVFLSFLVFPIKYYLKCLFIAFKSPLENIKLLKYAIPPPPHRKRHMLWS